MMRFPLILKLCLLPLLLVFLGCAASHPVDVPPTLLQMDIKPNGFTKRVAVLMNGSSCSVFESHVEEVFKQALIRTIREEARHLHLSPMDDAELTDFMVLPQTESPVVNQAALAELARSLGYQGVVVARVAHIESLEKKTGIFWFRKNRYFIDYNVLLDMYDPSTGAKMISRIIEKTKKITQQDYESLGNGSQVNNADFDETITELAENLGEEVADVLDNSLWRTSVVAVRADRVFLPARENSGLAAGDRLAVFKTQQFKDALDGHRFLLPEQKVAELRVVSVGAKLTEAVAEPGGVIQEGDLVIPLN